MLVLARRAGQNIIPKHHPKSDQKFAAVYRG